MNNSRLTFNTSTTLTVPSIICDILRGDAWHYGFIKNDQPNISGFLNRLIPVLSDYQDELHKRLLKYNNGDEHITRVVEQNILNVYLAPFNARDDITVTIPFRINQSYIDEFILIHDVKLLHYDIDFTTFIRNLLMEYATKTLGQREYLYAFREVQSIREAIQKQSLCHFYHQEGRISFAPVSMELSPINGCYVIVGCDKDKVPCFLPLSSIQNLLVDQVRLEISDEDCDNMWDAFQKYYEEEYD